MSQENPTFKKDGKRSFYCPFCKKFLGTIYVRPNAKVVTKMKTRTENLRCDYCKMKFDIQPPTKFKLPECNILKIEMGFSTIDPEPDEALVFDKKWE